MYEGFQKFGEEFQKAGKDGFEATVRSLGEVNRGRHPRLRAADRCKVGRAGD
jgi:hypothetical protein